MTELIGIVKILAMMAVATSMKEVRAMAKVTVKTMAVAMGVQTTTAAARTKATKVVMAYHYVQGAGDDKLINTVVGLASRRSHE
jgi:hypothetical protein